MSPWFFFGPARWRQVTTTKRWEGGGCVKSWWSEMGCLSSRTAPLANTVVCRRRLRRSGNKIAVDRNGRNWSKQPGPIRSSSFRLPSPLRGPFSSRTVLLADANSSSPSSDGGGFLSSFLPAATPRTSYGVHQHRFSGLGQFKTPFLHYR